MTPISDTRARYLYGTTLAELHEKEGTDICPLCLKRPSTCIDHSHDSGLVRGPLCRTCNLALSFYEDRAWRERARLWLRRGDLREWLTDIIERAYDNGSVLTENATPRQILAARLDRLAHRWIREQPLDQLAATELAEAA